MTGKRWIGATVAVGLLAGLVIALFSMNKESAQETTPTAPPVKETPFEAILFLPDENLSHLTVRKENLSSSPVMVERVRTVIETITDPGRSKGLFPDGMTPHDIFVYDETVVLGYGAEFGVRFAGGAAEELMGIDALVNSIVRTFDGIEKVRIVRPGEAPFIRHVDLTDPFVYSPPFVVEPAGDEMP